MKTTFIAIALTSAAAVSTPAAAEEVSVPYSDLDLTTNKGQVTLQQRIELAARRVCGFDDQTTGTRLRAQETKRCYALAKAQGLRTFAAIVSKGEGKG